MCFGGSAPAVPAPPPPPQAAQTPSAPALRANTAATINAQSGGTLLSGALGDPQLPAANLGKKSLLGQ